MRQVHCSVGYRPERFPHSRPIRWERFLRSLTNDLENLVISGDDSLVALRFRTDAHAMPHMLGEKVKAG